MKLCMAAFLAKTPAKLPQDELAPPLISDFTRICQRFYQAYSGNLRFVINDTIEHSFQLGAKISDAERSVYRQGVKIW